MLSRGSAIGIVATFLLACGGSTAGDSVGDAAATGGTSSGGTSGGGAGSGGAGGSIPGCGGFGGCGNQSGCCNPKTGQLEAPLCACGPCPAGDIQTWTCYAPGECGTDKPCAADEYCQFTNGACTGKGLCQKRPASCSPDAGAAACGCDGYARSSECAVHAAGIDSGASSACKIGCNSTACLRGLEYCEYHGANLAQSACKPLPTGCGIPLTCDCLAAEPCGSNCNAAEPSLLQCTN